MLLRVNVDHRELAESVLGWSEMGDMARFFDALFVRLEDQDMHYLGPLMNADTIRKCVALIKGHNEGHENEPQFDPNTGGVIRPVREI